MPVIADTHIHLYGCYDIKLAFEVLFRNLGRRTVDAWPAFSDGVTKAAFLTERQDCDFFGQLASGALNSSLSGIGLDETPERGCLAVDSAAGRLLLFAGRQIATKERIEVLGLAMTEKIPDGTVAADAVKIIKEYGGVPVLPWALGKWLAGRGRVVRGLIEASEAGGILLGDSSMRPTVWPEPGLMKLARKKGIGIVAGSDPLPVAGEENKMGVYATAIHGEIDPARPVACARQILLERQHDFKPVGSRRGLVEVLSRAI